ncbi:MAG: Rsd/AlgQ family anti-sigma factor [Methylococcales bacterium]
MKTQAQNFSKHRPKTQAMVEQLLKERQHMWSLYCQFAIQDEYADEQSVELALRGFCQVLIDYISLGHFGIYQRIAEGNERRQNVLTVAQQVYPKLIELTDHAVSFNDKYEDLHNQALVKELNTDLSELGESLAARIELEDKLIESLIT